MYNKLSSLEEAKGVTLNYVKDLHPHAKNLQMRLIVLHVQNSYKTKDGNEVRSCKVADKTGSINLSIWGDFGNYIQPGDILSLSRCYSVLFKNILTLYVGKHGTLTKTGEFCMTFSELPDLSEPNPEWIAHSQEKAASLQTPTTGNVAPPSHTSSKASIPISKSQNFRPK